MRDYSRDPVSVRHEVRNEPCAWSPVVMVTLFAALFHNKGHNGAGNAESMTVQKCHTDTMTITVLEAIASSSGRKQMTNY